MRVADLPESNGVAVLERTFEHACLPDLDLGELRPGRHLLVRNTSLLNCRTAPGTCWILGHVSLENVRFVDFDCGDALRIEIERGTIRDVVIEGGRPPRLSITKVSTDATEPGALDVRRYSGEVEVYGVDPRHVLFDRSRCAGLDVSGMTREGWTRMGIDALSYWRIVAGKAISLGTSFAVVSTPLEKARDYETSMRELSRLREASVAS